MATTEEARENPGGDSDRISLSQWMSQSTPPTSEITLSQLTFISNSILDVLTESSERAKCVRLRPELIELQRGRKDGTFEVFFQFDEQSDQTMETFLLSVIYLIIWAHERTVHGSEISFLGIRSAVEISHLVIVIQMNGQLKQRIIHLMPQPLQGHLLAATTNRQHVFSPHQPVQFQMYNNCPSMQPQAATNMGLNSIEPQEATPMDLNWSQPPSYSDVSKEVSYKAQSPNMPPWGAPPGFNSQAMYSPSEDPESLPFSSHPFSMTKQCSQQGPTSLMEMSASSSIQSISQNSLATALEEQEIESEFWMPVFKEEHRIRGFKGFNRLTRQELSETLQKHARDPWEIRAILSLLPDDQDELSSMGDSSINSTLDATERIDPNKEAIAAGGNIVPSQALCDSDTESESSDNGVDHECSETQETIVQGILSCLGLTKYYPQKLDQNTVLRWYGRELKSMADLVPVFLSRLISMDSGARDDITGKLLDDIRQTVPSTDPIHPLDVTTSIFMCADDFLRILLAEKLFLCKQSIPFLLPMQVGENGRKPILQLPLHGLIAQNAEGVESSVLIQKTKITCFMRIGTPEMSKSKLANELLKTDANIFAHQDLLDQNVQCSLSHGLVDIGWFLHNPKEIQNLQVPKSVITVLNLHGDAKYHMEERDLLIAVSNTCFITVSLEEFYKSKGIQTLNLLKTLAKNVKQALVIILSPDSKSSNGETNIKDIQATLTESLSRSDLELHVLSNYKGEKVKAKSCLEIIQKYKTRTSLSKQVNNCINGRLGFTLDEGAVACQEGKKLSDEIMHMVNEGKLKYVKNKYLPLQGDKWKEWAKLNKLKHRHSGKSGATGSNTLSKEELGTRMREMRKEQARLTKKGLSPLIKKVLATKSSAWQNSRPYFFFWLKLGFDNQSRAQLPALRKKHEKVWQELEVQLNESPNSLKARKLQDEFRSLDNDIAAESLGIEHIFRELSQLFEIKDESLVNSKNEDLSQLPYFMAELLLMGQPIELMDGDASHVAINWIKAVLEAVSKKVKHKRVLVLSVLGIQSSGKSTLLNGLFGLKFAVSAGRCTRGVYAQLVPAPDKFKLDYDYLLVVDTEGLRAPELGNTKESVEHDHEIATFVLGLGNINIINVKGENHAEMQDILQIVIHALLRMISANGSESNRLRPTSIFVHQNVSATNASQQMIASQRALLNNLNEMTLAAAEDLHLEYKFKKFNDLITFDTNKHAAYFSNLIKGVPPMAPTNIGYAEDVNMLKNLIFCESKTKSGLLNMRDLTLKLDELWSGILKENFIFSFRNAIEVRAYSSLESTLCKLTYKLQSTASKETTKGTEFIEAQSSDIDKHAQTVICDIVKSLETSFSEIELELEQFLSQNKDRGVMEQWHYKSVQKLKDTKDDLCRAKRKEIESIEHWTSTQITMDKKIEKYQIRLTDESKKLALSLKEKDQRLTERELKTEFDELWEVILNEMKHVVDRRDIMSVAYNILDSGPYKLQHCYLDAYWDQAWNEEAALDLCNLEGIVVPTIEESFLKRGISKVFGSKFAKVAEKLKALLARITHQCESSLMSLGKDKPFHESDLMNIQQVWNEHEKDLSTMMKELNEKTVLERLVSGNCYILRWAVQKLEQRQTAYLQKMNLRDHFHEKNNASMYNMFKNMYHETEAQGAIDIFVLNFWKAILKHVTAKQPLALLDVLKKEKCLETKSELQKGALKKLIQEDDFNSFFSYLKNTQKDLVQYITLFSESVMFGKRLLPGSPSVYSNISSMVLEETMDNVRNAFETVKGKEKGNIKQTLKDIREHLTSEAEIHFSKQVFDIERYGLDCRNISIDFFMKSVMLQLTSQIDEQKKLFSEAKKLPDPVADIVYTQLEENCIGCSEQCPFCKSVCTRTWTDHECDHSCLLHYPSGLGGWRSCLTEVLVAQTCSFNVQSGNYFRHGSNEDEKEHIFSPYTEYKQVHPNWTIIPDPEDKTSMFWQYAFAKFNKQFADKYLAKEAEIPKHWYDIKVDSVLISLDHELKDK